MGVSPGSIERDAARLRAAGIPLEVVTALVVVTGSRRDQVCQVLFSPGEVSALLAVLVAVGPSSSATDQSAFAKLTDALTPEENGSDRRHRFVGIRSRVGVMSDIDTQITDYLNRYAATLTAFDARPQLTCGPHPA